MNYISLTSEQKYEHQKWINLFESKYSFKFFEPTYNEVPHASKCFGGSLNKYASRFEYNLLGTYIVDMATISHMQMSRIREEFTEEEYAWYQVHNKLSINKISATFLGLDILNTYLNKNFKLTTFSNEEYKSMNFQERSALVKNIDVQIYCILEQLSKEYTSSKSRI
jgi:hypothetical protein